MPSIESFYGGIFRLTNHRDSIIVFLERTTDTVWEKNMEQNQHVEYLLHFGLTRQEALIYVELLLKGKQTGYEIAKETGISRSNAYSALAALTEKGAAYVVEESAKRYIPVKLEEFCGNCIRRMEREKEWMENNLPQEKAEMEGYITIEGEQNILDKAKNLMASANERIYLSCGKISLDFFRRELEELLRKKRKVVILTEAMCELEGAIFYQTEEKGQQIGLIVDSQSVLSGECGPGSLNTCLYSGQKNFVSVFKSAMANEIKLIQLQRGERIS